MKKSIKLSKSQWENIGRKTGWDKIHIAQVAPSTTPTVVIPQEIQVINNLMNQMGAALNGLQDVALKNKISGLLQQMNQTFQQGITSSAVYGTQQSAAQAAQAAPQAAPVATTSVS